MGMFRGRSIDWLIPRGSRWSTRSRFLLFKRRFIERRFWRRLGKEQAPKDGQAGYSG